MARHAGGGKNAVEGCPSIDVLELRRKGYLQPPVLPWESAVALSFQPQSSRVRNAPVWDCLSGVKGRAPAHGHRQSKLMRAITAFPR